MEGIKGKKFYISVDLEGVACAVGFPGQGLGNDRQLAFAAEQGVREANSAARALFEYGAGEVWVWDCHGSGVNFDYTSIDKRCKIMLGSGTGTRFPLIDESFGGVILIGYHAYDSPSSVMSHIYSSATYQYIKIDGRKVGEAEIDLAFAGKKGVPPMLIAGDDVFISQAKKSFPNVVFVQTKKALGWNAALSEHPLKIEDEIYEKTLEACKRIKSLKPYVILEPFTLECRFKRIEQAQNSSYHDINGKKFETVDEYTRKGVLESIERLFW